VRARGRVPEEDDDERVEQDQDERSNQAGQHSDGVQAGADEEAALGRQRELFAADGPSSPLRRAWDQIPTVAAPQRVAGKTVEERCGAAWWLTQIAPITRTVSA
jgi:hypothetical protein